MKSIQGQLVWRLLAWVCILWIGGGLAMTMIFRQGMIARFDSDLRQLASNARFVVHPGGRREAPEALETASLLATNSGVYMQAWGLFNAGEIYKSASLNGSDLTRPDEFAREPVFRDTLLSNGERIRQIEQRISLPMIGRPGRAPTYGIVAAKNLSELHAGQTKLIAGIAGVGIIGAILSVIIIRLTLRNGLRPLDEVSEAVAVVDTSNLRTVISHPRDFGTKRLPAVLYIQGIDCASIEATFPFPFPNLTRDFLYRLTRAGFVVMRCEKSGVGDSTGPDCNDLPLTQEVKDFAAAVKELKTHPFVDPNQVYLFGHSAGGWVAPIVAQKESVAGIVVYGTVVRPFAEYMVENHRRNRRLRNDLPPAQIEEQTVHMRQFLHHLLDERKRPADIIKQRPELVAISKRVFPKDQKRPYNVRNIDYFRDVNDLNMAEVWTTLRIPTLALCGEYEVRTSPFEHEYIAQIVNQSKPGFGEWKVIPKLDHGFAKHDSHTAAAKNEFKGPFGEQVVTETVQWLRKQIKRNQP